jgi:hypothetical protein
VKHLVSEITRFEISQIFCVILSNMPSKGVLGNLPVEGNLKQQITAAVEVVFSEYVGMYGLDVCCAFNFVS